jgi:hypothetical protein
MVAKLLQVNQRFDSLTEEAKQILEGRKNVGSIEEVKTLLSKLHEV